MSLLLAAVGRRWRRTRRTHRRAVPPIGDAQPTSSSSFAVIWTVAVGIEGGLVWAFIGGLMIDFLAPRPLGSTAFTLLICRRRAPALLAQAACAVPLLVADPRRRRLLSFVYSMTLFLVVYGALRARSRVATRCGVLPGAIYNTVLAALVGPLAGLASTTGSVEDASGSTGERVRSSTGTRRAAPPSVALPRRSALAVIIGVSGLTARLVYLQLVNGGQFAQPCRGQPDRRSRRSRRRAA